MVNIGCVAKLLSNLKMGNGYWVKRVNPNWYEARQVPKTLLSDKIAEIPKKATVRPRRRTNGHNYTKQCMSPISNKLAQL